MRWLGLAARVLDLSVSADHGGGDVEGAAVVFRESEVDGDVVLLSGLTDELHLGGVDLKGIVNVLADAFEVDGLFPDEVRVAWDEALGETDQLAALLGGQGYVFACFGDIGVQVEVDGFELGGCHADDLWVGVFGGGG